MGRPRWSDKEGLKKGPWTPEEDEKLIAYIAKHGHYSWKDIPLKSGLRRNGNGCRFRWNNYLRPGIKRGKFSLEVEQLIIQLQALWGNKPQSSDKESLKKGPWTPEEDEKLIAYVAKHGHDSWKDIPLKYGLRRSGKSCRYRWNTYLRPGIKRGKFSLEEEQTIIQLQALWGNRWSAIARHMQNRSDNEIKKYWHTHLKRKLTEAGKDQKTDKSKNLAPISKDTTSKGARLTIQPNQCSTWSKTSNEAGGGAHSTSMSTISLKEEWSCEEDWEGYGDNNEETIRDFPFIDEFTEVLLSNISTTCLSENGGSVDDEDRKDCINSDFHMASSSHQASSPMF